MKTVYEANPALGDPMSIQVCLCPFSLLLPQPAYSIGSTNREWAQARQVEVRSSQISGGRGVSGLHSWVYIKRQNVSSCPGLVGGGRRESSWEPSKHLEQSWQWQWQQSKEVFCVRWSREFKQVLETATSNSELLSTYYWIWMDLTWHFQVCLWFKCEP